MKTQTINLELLLTLELIKEVENNIDYKENTKYNLDYFSIPSDLLLDNLFMDKIEQFSAHYFLFFCFLKVQMANMGRYYFYSKNIKRIIKNYCVNYSAEIEEITNIYEDLLINKNIFKFQDSSIFGGEEIITEPYLFYNYRLTNSKRAYNRQKKQEEREKKKNNEVAPTSPNFKINTDLDINEDESNPYF